LSSQAAGPWPIRVHFVGIQRFQFGYAPRRTPRVTRQDGLMQTPQWLQRWDVRTVFVILGVVVFPSVMTLLTIQIPTRPLDFDLRSAPYGYTVSLLIYLVPVFAINWWFRRRYRETDGIDDRRSAFRWTLITLIPIGFLLDILFGYAFLTFPNPSAILPLPLFWSVSFAEWSFVRHIPIEEFAFYTLGFIAILYSYIWCDEFWLSKYNEPDFGRTAKKTPIVQIQLAGPLTIAVLLIGAGIRKGFRPTSCSSCSSRSFRASCSSNR
jgi:hypothetical protein